MFLKGPTWTHEALYRETAREVELCQKEGILTVDMEAAALFAVAAYHKVEIASLFTISDSLADFVWKPQSLHKDVPRTLETLFKIAIAVAHL